LAKNRFWMNPGRLVCRAVRRLAQATYRLSSEIARATAVMISETGSFIDVLLSVGRRTVPSGASGITMIAVGGTGRQP
jgi:UTP:GlnB (protein PII) uridylyltransferase